jgi:lysyl endopeptidase
MKFVTLAILAIAAPALAGTTFFPSLDVNKMHKAELRRERKGVAPHFAVARQVRINALQDQAWTEEGDMMVWRHEVTATNAVSLNFGFGEYSLPEGASLTVSSKDLRHSIRAFTAADNNSAAELWTPVIMSDSAVIELRVPSASLDETRLVLTTVGQGFRTFAQKTQKSGSCNVDVVCSDGDQWRDEIGSVAVLSSRGTSFCTGAMINNTANDRTPYFLTAAHCRVTAASAPSLVTYWNYQTAQCGGARNGQKTQFTTGATHLATSGKTDFTLVKLNSMPQRDWGVTFAGWDRSGDDARQAVAIHHPNTDEKSISFENDPTTVTDYLGEAVPGDGSHIRITDWDKGTTEPGSSGSPLFNQDHRIIGQLHGGWASCTSQTSDYYGRLSRSWDGEGARGKRLKDFLDAGNTGLMVTDTIE